MKMNFNKPSKLLYFSFLLLICSSLWGKECPKRIVSLGAAATEILFELGAENQLVAVSSDSNFPEAAKKLPSAGGFGTGNVSIEKLISFEPDFVILYSGVQDYLIPSLKRYKIAHYVSNVSSVTDIIEEIQKIGEITGHKEKSLELAKQYSDAISEISKNAAEKQKKNVYWEIWNEPYMSGGAESFINDVIKMAGGQNIFGHIKQAYPVVSEESILYANPEYVLLFSDSGKDAESVKKRSGWSCIDAVKNDRIFIVNSDIYNRPGPRIFTAIKELNSILYE